MISAVVSVLLATTVSSSNLRVDGQAITRQATFQGKHNVALARGDNRLIEGELSIQPNRGGFRVVARIPLEDYVAAALENEAREFEAPEALKAMAVTIRTYVAANAHRHGVADLCDGTHCQRLTFPASARMKEAAQATKGEVVWYAKAPARVFYHENCGGQTASAASVWGGDGLPYLVSRRDPYCERRPGAWRADVTKASLERVLSTPAAQNFSTQPGDAPMQLRIVGRNASGRVSAVSMGSNSWSGTRFRELLSGMSGQPAVRSARFQIFDKGDRLTLVGLGAGHGVGLCQHGTVARALAGEPYRAILAEYFPGTRIGVSP